jgi:hypothetical protein
VLTLRHLFALRQHAGVLALALAALLLWVVRRLWRD